MSCCCLFRNCGWFDSRGMEGDEEKRMTVDGVLMISPLRGGIEM